MSKAILITGATGSIGAKLVSTILKGDSDTRVILLVRGNCEAEARTRVEGSLRIVSPELKTSQYNGRIDIVTGDITRANLGVSNSTYERLLSEVTDIVHSAAATGFLTPLASAREINLGGTKNVMTFAAQAADRGRLHGVAHISTAYVNSSCKSTIYENTFASRCSFLHSYDQTKWEAEHYVRKLMSSLPIAIFRPSVVVGDSHTGRTSAFNVLYTPLRFICQGQVSVLPGCPDVKLDVVSSDYVADVIHHIFVKKSGGIGNTYQIVAGVEKSLTIDEIVGRTLDFAAAFRGRADMQPVRWLSPELFDSLCGDKANRLVRMIKIFQPYMSRHLRFDNTNTQSALEGSGIALKHLADYFDTIIGYCLTSNWGRSERRAA